MVRYARQRDQYSCGPVALLNILKWMGMKASYKQLVPTLQILCKCDAGVGTERPDMQRALKKLGIKNKRKVHPKLKSVDEHIDNGGIILVEYFWTPVEGHFTLCIDRTPTHYILVNDEESVAITRCTRKAFLRMIRRRREDEDPWTWFITR